MSQHLDQQQGVRSGLLWLLLSEKCGTALGEYKQMPSRHLSYKAQIDFFFFSLSEDAVPPYFGSDLMDELGECVTLAGKLGAKYY